MNKLVLLALSLLLMTGCAVTSTKFQKDADIIRLNHLEYYGTIIESYYEKTGIYPFQGDHAVPAYVHVANDRQVQYTRSGPPYDHEVIPFKDFVEELESELGKEIKEYYDPQYAPDYKPNFYIYMVNGSTYYFAVHVHQPYKFAKKVADDYYKVELSNHANAQNMAATPEVLFSSPEFKAAKGAPISKEAFFRERENAYIHHTKDDE